MTTGLGEEKNWFQTNFTRYKESMSNNWWNSSNIPEGKISIRNQEKIGLCSRVVEKCQLYCIYYYCHVGNSSKEETD